MSLVFNKGDNNVLNPLLEFNRARESISPCQETTHVSHELSGLSAELGNMICRFKV